jgi:hypothetical protein
MPGLVLGTWNVVFLYFSNKNKNKSQNKYKKNTKQYQIEKNPPPKKSIKQTTAQTKSIS